MSAVYVGIHLNDLYGATMHLLSPCIDDVVIGTGHKGALMPSTTGSQMSL